MRIIARDDVEALGLGLAEAVPALESAFLAGRRGAIDFRPKSTISRPDGAFLIAAHAAWPERNLGLFHSIMGTAPANVPHGAPHYTTRQLLSDYRRGVPVALIDGTWTSTILPAGVTAIAARRLARPDSAVVSFVGAGVQARVNLAALQPLFPLREVRVLSRTAASAQGFAAHAAACGLQVRVFEDARAALEGADIIVTSVPGAPGLRPFLDPDWVGEGAFVSAVDIGRSWRGGFERFERLVTDDRAQALAQHADGRMPHAGPYDTEIPELLDASRPGRQRREERIVLIHPGNVVGVFGLSALIRDRVAGA